MTRCRCGSTTWYNTVDPQAEEEDSMACAECHRIYHVSTNKEFTATLTETRHKSMEEPEPDAYFYTTYHYIIILLPDSLLDSMVSA